MTDTKTTIEYVVYWMLQVVITVAILLFAGSARLDNAPITGGRIYLTEKDSCDIVERNEGFVSIVCTQVTHVR